MSLRPRGAYIKLACYKNTRAMSASKLFAGQQCLHNPALNGLTRAKSIFTVSKDEQNKLFND